MKLSLYFICLVVFGSIFFTSSHEKVSAQQGPNQLGGDALWHLPKFGEDGWFIHAHNGSVRVCNMNNASIVGNRQGPKCSNWE